MYYTHYCREHDVFHTLEEKRVTNPCEMEGRCKTHIIRKVSEKGVFDRNPKTGKLEKVFSF